MIWAFRFVISCLLSFGRLFFFVFLILGVLGLLHMSQQRQIHGVGGNYNGGKLINDTTYTKIFVGGLAWETQRDTMKKYFEQFGEILEAVVIADKSTGRSKGYGFVSTIITLLPPKLLQKTASNAGSMLGIGSYSYYCKFGRLI